jgi:alkylation response protein AidB-like acyl-CoA dehydrogenase
MRVDAAVSAEVLRAISPLAIEAAFQLIADREWAGAERLRQSELALEQARYEVTAVDTLIELAVTKRPDWTTQRLYDDHGAQARIAQAEALVRSARLFLFDSVSRLWGQVIAEGGATMEARADLRLAISHAVSNAVQAVDLVYLTAGATSLYASCPLERVFRDVHAITQHVAVHPRLMEAAGRVLFGLEPNNPMI